MTGQITEEILTDLNNSLALFTLPQIKELVQQVAHLTGEYYNTLIGDGVPPDHAATIAASYSSQIAALRR